MLQLVLWHESKIDLISIYELNRSHIWCKQLTLPQHQNPTSVGPGWRPPLLKSNRRPTLISLRWQCRDRCRHRWGSKTTPRSAHRSFCLWTLRTPKVDLKLPGTSSRATWSSSGNTCLLARFQPAYDLQPMRFSCTMCYDSKMFCAASLDHWPWLGLTPSPQSRWKMENICM